MKSKVAEAARAAQAQKVQDMTPGERVRRALELGYQHCSMYAAAHGLTYQEARRALQARETEATSL